MKMLKFNSAKTFYKLACCLSMMVWLSFTVHSQDLVVSRGTTTLSTTAVYASLDLSGGTLIVQSPAILTITGAATVRNTGTLIVNEGATLIVGAGIDLRNTSLTTINGTLTVTSGGLSFANRATASFGGNNIINITGPVDIGGSGSTLHTLTIGAGVRMNIIGDVTHSNSATVTVAGTLAVTGNYASSNSATLDGTGNFTTTGSMNTRNTSSIFGISPFNCSANCDPRNTCNSITNNITTPITQFCNSFSSVRINANAVGSAATYTWESSTTSSTAGFAAASGTNNAQSYTTGAGIANTTWYRRKVVTGGCTKYSNVIQLSVINTDDLTITGPLTGAACSGSIFNSGTVSSNAPTFNWSRAVVAGISNPAGRASGVSVATGISETLINTTTSVKTVRYVLTPISSACAGSPSVLNVTVYPSIGNNTIGTNQTICYNTVPSTMTGTAALTGGNGTYSFQWQYSTDNSTFANLVGATQESYTPTALTVNTSYRRLVSSGTCSATSNVIIKQINTSSFAWTGSANSDWNTAGNWCSNALPTATSDVTIGNGLANYPIISSLGQARNINIDAGASLILNGQAVLNLKGNWTNNGTVLAKDGSIVQFSANNGVQTIAGAGTQTFYTLHKISNGTLRIANNSSVTLRRGGIIRVAAGIFDLNSRPLVLKSKISDTGVDSTASLDIVTGTLINANNFTIERYNGPVRGIRYYSTPLKNVTLKSLQDSIIISGPESGGFDAPHSNVATAKQYLEDRSDVLSRGFVSLSSVSTVLNPGQGYYLFVPAKRTTVYPANEPVTLVTKGAPVTGKFNFNVSYTTGASEGWNLLGNPYPSSIDWDHPAWSKRNITDALYMWDPNLGGEGGAYYSYVAGISSDGRENGSIIPSGHGFFIKASNANPTLAVNEAAKVLSPYPHANARLAEISYITLKVSDAAGNIDYTSIRLDGTDRALKALKLRSGTLDIFTRTESEADDYSINGAFEGSPLEVPVYIEAAKNGPCLIEVIKVVGSLSPSLKIKDYSTGKLWDIYQGFKITIDPAKAVPSIAVINSDHDGIITSQGTSNNMETYYHMFPTNLDKGVTPTLYSNDPQLKHIEIYTAKGDRISRSSSTDKQTMLNEFNHYASGIYIVKVYSQHHSQTFKIIK